MTSGSSDGPVDGGAPGPGRDEADAHRIDPRLTDSAGQPWEGRHLEQPAFAADDGSAPPRLLEALRRFGADEVGQAEVVAALRGTRLLVPLLAVRGESGLGPHGQTVDKSAELAIVTVEGRDGRKVLPAFTSVTALTAWNPRARPVPVEVERVALAAASEDTELVVLDPRSDTEFGLRRSALEALARGTGWVPAWQDTAVTGAIAAGIADEAAVVAAEVRSGDPTASLTGAELQVRLELAPGLDRRALDALLARVGERWARSPALAAVDGISMVLATAGTDR